MVKKLLTFAMSVVIAGSAIAQTTASPPGMTNDNGAGAMICADGSGGVYEVGQTWGGNPPTNSYTCWDATLSNGAIQYTNLGTTINDPDTDKNKEPLLCGVSASAGFVFAAEHQGNYDIKVLIFGSNNYAKIVDLAGIPGHLSFHKASCLQFL